jgi:hypothetical protein
MIMKIITYVVIALLVASLGAAAVFYFYIYQPMVTDYARMKAGIPELDKARAELKKVRERESRDAAWINPAVDAVSSILSDEVEAGKAEVLAAGNRVVVNIAEDSLYLPGSYTFSKTSPPLRAKLITLLRRDELKGKNLFIGNTTEGVQAQGKGRKRVPAKDARTLASERSAALIRDFEKNGVDQDSLIAAAYTSKQPAVGFKLKSHKTVIIIETPPLAPVIASKQAPVQETQSKPTSTAKAPSTTTAAPPQAQPKAIPIQPTQSKTQ